MGRFRGGVSVRRFLLTEGSPAEVCQRISPEGKVPGGSVKRSVPSGRSPGGGSVKRFLLTGGSPGGFVRRFRLRGESQRVKNNTRRRINFLFWFTQHMHMYIFVYAFNKKRIKCKYGCVLVWSGVFGFFVELERFGVLVCVGAF